MAKRNKFGRSKSRMIVAGVGSPSLLLGVENGAF
jgi:hypothetical protein